jgi:hypothetical protein
MVRQRNLGKQLAVALSDDVRARLESAAAAAGHSVSEEVRRRIEKSFDKDTELLTGAGVGDPKFRRLAKVIGLLKELAYYETAHTWYNHPTAFRLFERAIALHFSRMRGEWPALDEPPPPSKAPSEMYKDSNLVVSGDLETKAAALEAIAFYQIEHPEFRSSERLHSVLKSGGEPLSSKKSTLAPVPPPPAPPLTTAKKEEKQS